MGSLATGLLWRLVRNVQMLLRGGSGPTLNFVYNGKKRLRDLSAELLRLQEYHNFFGFQGIFYVPYSFDYNMLILFVIKRDLSRSRFYYRCFSHQEFVNSFNY